MSNPLRFTYDDTFRGWRCYYDPEGPCGFSDVSKEGALGDLIDQCNDEHRGPLLLGAIVAAIPEQSSDRTPDVVALLRRIQWSHDGTCPECGAWSKVRGDRLGGIPGSGQHTPSCEIGRLISDVPARGPSGPEWRNHCTCMPPDVDVRFVVHAPSCPKSPHSKTPLPGGGD